MKRTSLALSILLILFAGGVNAYVEKSLLCKPLIEASEGSYYPDEMIQISGFRAISYSLLEIPPADPIDLWSSLKMPYPWVTYSDDYIDLSFVSKNRVTWRIFRKTLGLQIWVNEGSTEQQFQCEIISDKEFQKKLDQHESLKDEYRNRGKKGNKI